MATDEIDDIFAEIAEKQARLFSDFAKSDTEVLEGVVAASGVGATTRGEARHLTFQTVPWRIKGQELIHRKATVHKRCSRAECDAIFDVLSAYSVFRIEAKVLRSVEGWDGAQVELLRILDPNLDSPDLVGAAEELKRPFIVDSQYFGRLELDRSVNWLEGRRKRGLFGSYKIHICRDGQAYNEAFASERLEAVERLLPSLPDMIADALFNIYSENWNSLGQISRSRFCRRISLSSVTINPSGACECWYSDGGLFLGHDIEVRIAADDTITQISLAG